MLSQNLLALRQLLALVLLLGFAPLSAQENCTNGIDDDGDGLIDLNDIEDCSCSLPSVTPSLVPNPSLEEFSADQPGCNSRQPNGLPDATNQANCLVGWERISLGTTDAWNAFTLPGSSPSFPAELPQPLPSGTSVAGFWVGIQDTEGVQFVNGDGSAVRGYREYLAACLTEDQTIEDGEDYRLTFSLGFMKPQKMKLSYTKSTVAMSSPSDIELGVYGVKNCDQLNFGSFYGCPEDSGAEGYELIANITVPGNPGEWSAASLDFTAAGDYAAFAIGGSCAEDIKPDNGGRYRNYYFIDDIILNKREVFEQAVAGPITVAGPVSVAGQSMCDNDIVLSGRQVEGADYQWYRDGIAIVGATTHILPVENEGEVDGNYSMRVTTPRGCALTNPVRIQRPVIPDQFPDSLALCAPGSAVTLYPSNLSSADYQWSDGSTKDFFTVEEPGTYSVTVTSGCVQEIETIVATYAESVPYSYVMSPEAPCIGDTVEISLKTNYYAPLTIYMLSTGEQYFVEGSKPIRVVAGEVTEINTLLLTSCGMHPDVVVIPELTPREVTATVTDMNCHGPQGSIVLASAEGVILETQYRWTGPGGELLGARTPSITATVPGQYSVEVSGGNYCPATYDYEVTDNDNFSLLVNASDVSCGNDAVAFALATGGTPPYAVNWLKEADEPPVAATGSVATDLDRGTFLAEVTDQHGCSTTTTFTVQGPDPVRIQTAEAETAGCHEDASGTLAITATGGTLPYSYRLEGERESQDLSRFTGLGEGVHSIVVTDAHDCDSPPVDVEVELPTTFDIDAGEDRTIYLGESTQLDLTIEGMNPEEGEITWSSTQDARFPYGPQANSTVVFSPTTTTEYFVTFTSFDQCSRTDSINVVVDNTYRSYAPTAFSPNNDGNNDFFTFYGNPVVEEVIELQVFDRWGGLVWEKPEDAPGEWDGTRSGESASRGTYVYKGALRMRDGTTTEVRGSVVLVK